VTKRFIGVLACSLIGGSASAFELGVGLEFAGTGTHVGNGLEGSAKGWGGVGGGVILEQRFDLPGVLLEAWEDVQTPLQVQTGSADQTAGYLPFDAGFRLGLAPGALQYYFGIVLQGLFLTSRPTQGAALKDAALALGGDLGLDLAVFFVRIGLEGRLTEVLTGLTPSCTGSTQSCTRPDPGGVVVFQGLLSLRASF
jgi:hypothetical protein